LDKKDSNLINGGKKISFFEKNFLTASFWQWVTVALSL
jgi:hypothetical protein